MVVLDSSAVVDYLVGLTAREWVIERLVDDPDVHAPHLLDVEVLGALRRLTASKRITARRAQAALADLLALDVTRYPHAPLLPRMWQLRANVTAGDAAFAALAEALGATLVTTDRRLAGAPGIRAQIVAPPAQ